MAAKQHDRFGKARPTHDDRTSEDKSYTADWQRKSRKEIVEEAIKSLGEDLRKALKKDRSEMADHA